MQIRTGKTLTALHTAHLTGLQRVLFVTKKKAIASIEKDFNDAGYTYNLQITNYEQLHNINYLPDVVIVDEAHGVGAYPKPSLRYKQLKALCERALVMLLSGTPSPESYSQLYHQFNLSPLSPFDKYSNFYKWANVFVLKKQKKVNGMFINDYSHARKELIDEAIEHYFIKYTQEEAGFTQHEVKEVIIGITPDPNTFRLAKRIIDSKYFKFKDGTEVVADSAVKVQNKLHQVFSGTVITECGNRKVLDKSKAEYIKANYQGQRIAVFYKFQAEREALLQTLSNITESPEEFNDSTDKVFISQIQSGSMGVNLSTADVIIMYNIDFSATQYWQVRGRMQHKSRTKEAVLHWLFTKDGIEFKIYQAVSKKKDYTLSYFRRDYL